MSERRSYPTDLVINGRPIHEIVIDPHYQSKHSDIDDPLILELVRGLNGREFQPESREGDWEFLCSTELTTNRSSTGWFGVFGTTVCLSA